MILYQWYLSINKFLLILLITSNTIIQIDCKIASIVNGFSKPIEPNLGEFPFHANLMQWLPDRRTYFSFCGGSLIQPKWVLTAAHCIQLDSTTPSIKIEETVVALGSIYRNGRNGQILRIERTIIHSKYLQSGGYNDIGLIKLKTNAKLNNKVKLIKLHTNPKESLIGKTAYLTGFGIINDMYQTPERLRKAILHISDNNKCFNNIKTTNIEICATSTIGEGKACKGDSGGPLFIIKNNKPIQIGITSRLSLLPICQITINNSIYTRISNYIQWIKNITGINNF